MHGSANWYHAPKKGNHASIYQGHVLKVVVHVTPIAFPAMRFGHSRR